MYKRLTLVDSAFGDWLVPYGSIIHDLIPRCDLATIAYDPLDSILPAEAQKRAAATNAFLRAVAIRLAHFKSIFPPSASVLRPRFDPVYKATEADFKEFAQSGLALVGVDSDAAFVMLSLGRDLFDVLVKKEGVAAALQTEVFSFFDSLCEATSKLDSRSASFEKKTEVRRSIQRRTAFIRWCVCVRSSNIFNAINTPPNTLVAAAQGYHIFA